MCSSYHLQARKGVAHAATSPRERDSPSSSVPPSAVPAVTFRDDYTILILLSASDPQAAFGRL